MPLAEHLVVKGYSVKASTTSNSRLAELSSINIKPFIIDIGMITTNIQTFLQANILIINIPVKNSDYFGSLIREIEASAIEQVLFVSSTSVYENMNHVISESDGVESAQSSSFKIEMLLRNSKKLKLQLLGLVG